MAEQKVRVCDYCPQDNPLMSIETLLIKPSRSKSVQRDVCTGHRAMVMGEPTPKKANGTVTDIATRRVHRIDMRCNEHDFESGGAGMAQHFRFHHPDEDFREFKDALRQDYNAVHAVQVS